MPFIDFEGNPVSKGVVVTDERTVDLSDDDLTGGLNSSLTDDLDIADDADGQAAIQISSLVTIDNIGEILVSTSTDDDGNFQDFEQLIEGATEAGSFITAEPSEFEENVVVVQFYDDGGSAQLTGSTYDGTGDLAVRVAAEGY